MALVLSTTRTRRSSLVSAVLFFTIFLLFYVSPTPFRDFANVSPAELERANPALQLIAVSMFLLTAVWVLATRRFLIGAMLSPVAIAMFAWFAVCSTLGSDPPTSLKRLALAVIVVCLAAAAVTLPASLRQFSALIAALTLITIGLCFFGVVALPGVAIHQDGDLIDPTLGGLWRGVFQHKNIASPMMVIFIFAGLFVARQTSRLLGWLIVGLAVAFLAGAGGKTALALCPVVLGLAHVVLRTRSMAWRIVAATAPLVLLNLFTVGSVVFPPIAEINKTIMKDPSFTGRTDLWQFGVDAVAHRPVFGYGFSNFWRAPVVINSESEKLEGNSPEGQIPTWIRIASHSHNSMLDVTIAAGVPGVLLFLWWIILTPLGNLAKIAPSEETRDFLALLVRVWLFGTTTMAVEALAFDRTNPVWFTVLFAVFGLCVLARYGVHADAGARMSPAATVLVPTFASDYVPSDDETSSTAISLQDAEAGVFDRSAA